MAAHSHLNDTVLLGAASLAGLSGVSLALPWLTEGSGAVDVYRGRASRCVPMSTTRLLAFAGALASVGYIVGSDSPAVGFDQP
jgi:hypothetical protein